MTNDEIRLHFGELNASEMRLARAIVGWHERQIEELKKWDHAKETAVDNVLRILPELNASPSWEDAANNVRTSIDSLKAENAKLRAGMAEAFKVIDVLYRDALANNEEGWPRARNWIERWEEFKPNNKATKSWVTRQEQEVAK